MESENENKKFPANVVKIIDDFQVVVNRGFTHGIKANQRFLIYELDPAELKDPSTGESLGQLEIVKGTGKAIHVQEKISTIESDIYAPAKKTTRLQQQPGPLGLLFNVGPTSETISTEGDLLPFKNPKAGDKAKPI